MSRLSQIVTLLLLAYACHSAAPGQPRPATLFVSPQGDDSWSGTLAAANQNHTDGPFATLERARDAVRKLPRIPGFTTTVFLRGGTYLRDSTFLLGPADGGTTSSPILWRSYPGESVCLTGAVPLAGFRTAAGLPQAARLVGHAQDSVRVADLRAQGITRYGTITPRGTPGLELFFRGKRMTLARWPNNGWERIADVPQSGDSVLHPGLEREKRFAGVPVGRHYGRITYNGNRPSRWSASSDAYLHGYWTWDWSDSYQKVRGFDTSSHAIILAPPYHNYGFTKNQRFYYLNILEELDSPGEWYLDRQNGLLFFWPPAAPSPGDLQVSLLDSALVELRGTSSLTLAGIVFTCSRGKGVIVRNGVRTRIAGCTFTGLGDDAVLIDGGSDNHVVSCDIFDVALGGIRLGGGERTTLTPAGNTAENNHIHHYSAWLRTGQYAVVIDGVGNQVRHCLIHDAPFEALYLRGNDHVVEYNEIHHVTQETGDAGALHTGRDWTWRGNVIRFNYFHDLAGPGLHGVMAVYLDDFASGFTVYGNLFYRAGRAAFVGGGRDNVVENNLFVECAPSVHIDARGLGWASYYFDGTYPELFRLMDAVHYDAPPYSNRYPQLLTLYSDDPPVPKHNRVVRNVSCGGRWLDVYDYPAFDFSVVTMTENVIADPDLWRRRSKGASGWDPYYLNIDSQQGYELIRNGTDVARRELNGNLLLEGNPGIRDPAQGDFHLVASSPAHTFGFKPLPLDLMGLHLDEYRRSLPRAASP